MSDDSRSPSLCVAWVSDRPATNSTRFAGMGQLDPEAERVPVGTDAGGGRQLHIRLRGTGIASDNRHCLGLSAAQIEPPPVILRLA